AGRARALRQLRPRCAGGRGGGDRVRGRPEPDRAGRAAWRIYRYYTRPSQKPVGRITAITHRRKPIFQGLLTGKPITENHILKQVPFEASFFRTLKRQFPTITQISVRASAGVSFYVVIAMQPRYAGEARQVILAAMASNIRPKW